MSMQPPSDPGWGDQPPYSEPPSGTPPYGQQHGWSQPHQFGQPPPSAGTRKRRGKPALITGLVLMLLSLLMGIPGVIGAINEGENTVDAFKGVDKNPGTTPHTFVFESDAASYAVFERQTPHPTTTGPDPFMLDPAVTVIQPENVTVSWVGSGPERPPITATRPSHQTFNFNGDLWVAAAIFNVPEPGPYEVTVTASKPINFRVSKSLGSGLGEAGGSIGKAIGWSILAGFASLLFLAGFITAIVGLILRSTSGSSEPQYQ